MITYQKVEGATAAADAKTFTPSAEGQAMAHIPGWQLLYDPSFTLSDKLQNRCIKNRYDSLVAGVINKGLINSQTAFNPTDAANIRVNPNLDFPRDNWSVVFVAKPSVKSISDINSIVTANTYKATAIVPCIAFTASTNSLKIYKGGALGDTEARLTYLSPTPLANETAVYIITGSSKTGLAIYKNGILVANNSNKDLFTEQYAAGEWNILRGARGAFGYIGILAIDLNDPINKLFREQINTFLMQKYGV